MEIKILQVFYGKDGLPYKDKERQVHFPITGTGFLGASNTTKIKFYYDELDNLDETTWVAVSKLPNGRVGSRVLESYLDDELNEHYALLELDNYYTQYKGDVFISLQGYQGGVNVDYDEENSQYEIHGTPTIAATGSIKFTINYANQFVGSGETDNINFQRVLASLGTKLGMRAYSEHVEELPSVGSPDVFYVINDDPDNPTLANIYVWNENTQHYVWVGDNSLYLDNYYPKEDGERLEEELEETNSRIDGLGAAYNFKGSKTVAQINALTGMTAGDAYNLTDSGTITTGSVVVSAGDNVAWNGTAWDKLSNSIDLSGYATKEFVQSRYQKKLVAGNNIYIDQETNIISVSKTVAEKDIIWEKLWQAPRQANTNVANLGCMAEGCCASLPIFLKAGTVITLDKTIFENIYNDTNNKAYFGITKIEKESVTDFLMNRYDLINGNEFTIATDGYYCFSVFDAGTGEIDIIKTYGNPVEFSYKADEDFEPNYVLAQDWGKLKIFIGTNAILPAFDNYIEWACHRQLGKPVIISNDGKGSINACYLYQYTTNDFTGTKSSVGRQNVIRVKDELWIVGASKDGGVGIGTIQKLLVYPNGWVKYLGRVWHNLGHLNSASYDKEYDILAFGNGSTDYSLEGVGSIIKNLTETDLYSSYDNEIVLLSDLGANLEQQNYPILTYGFKCNLITIGTTCASHVKYLNFAMVTNDGNTFRLGKVDVNSLSLANIVWEDAVDVGDTSETHEQSYSHAIATAVMFNGKLTWAEGHANTPVVYVEKDRQGSYSLNGHFIELYDGIGNICNYDGKLLVGTSGEITVTDVSSL